MHPFMRVHWQLCTPGCLCVHSYVDCLLSLTSVHLCMPSSCRARCTNVKGVHEQSDAWMNPIRAQHNSLGSSCNVWMPLKGQRSNVECPFPAAGAESVEDSINWRKGRSALSLLAHWPFRATLSDTGGLGGCASVGACRSVC